MVESDAGYNPLAADVGAVFREINRRDVRIGVISDIHFDIRPAFDRAGLLPLIELFVLSFEHGVQKPQPDISIQVPMPILVVQRAEPEGVQVKSTKSNRTRRVPVADRVLLIVRALAEGREADAPLFVTASGHRLHATAFKRTLDWLNVAEGRRIHDLRHTAACLWLSLGVDVVTVQTWMGHASVATTNLYLHHLGTSADRAGLDRLNRRGHAGGAQSQARPE